MGPLTPFICCLTIFTPSFDLCLVLLIGLQVWQRTQSQGDLWKVLHLHVVTQEVHQIVLEASVGGEAGDIAVDNIVFATGACPLSGASAITLGQMNTTTI